MQRDLELVPAAAVLGLSKKGRGPLWGVFNARKDSTQPDGGIGQPMWSHGRLKYLAGADRMMTKPVSRHGRGPGHEGEY